MLFIWIDRLLEWVNQHQLVFFILMVNTLLSDIWGKQQNLMLQISWTNESQFTTVLNDDIHKWTLCRLPLLLIAAPRVSRLSVIYSVSFAGDLHFSQHCHCLIYSVGAPVVKSAPPSDSLGGGGSGSGSGGGFHLQPDNTSSPAEIMLLTPRNRTNYLLSDNIIQTICCLFNLLSTTKCKWPRLGAIERRVGVGNWAPVCDCRVTQLLSCHWHSCTQWNMHSNNWNKLSLHDAAWAFA